MKKAYKIKRCINPLIKEGDIVRIRDGSGLAFVNEDIKIEPYIVDSYSKIFGVNTKLQYLNFKVVKTGISDVITDIHLNFCFGVDIIIEYNHIQLYTCSQFIHKYLKS